MGFLTGLVLSLFIFSAVILILLVTFFQTKGGGMGGLMGGGASQTPFGSSSADVLTKVTRYTALSFILLSLLLSFLFASKQDKLIPPEGKLIPDKTAPSMSNTPKNENTETKKPDAETPKKETIPVEKK
ncbi:MAG: preprotein translocase subunit SecG [Leptospiraceae bacterium]|nr:preprotein translocase subunit SecG [Leptospiraceae bacterium]MCP5500380.1 preprotein translocase subunit SecG [Leptospiraceae bacterium]